MAKRSARSSTVASQRPAPEAASSGAGASRYLGERFGLPEHGPMSAASMGRRVVALFIDWGLCLLIASGLARSTYWAPAVFAAEDFLLTASAGTTIGKRIMGIRVIRTGGGPVGPLWSAVRTLLLLAVVPPLLSDRDLRGLHDRASDTIVVQI